MEDGKINEGDLARSRTVSCSMQDAIKDLFNLNPSEK